MVQGIVVWWASNTNVTGADSFLAEFGQCWLGAQDTHGNQKKEPFKVLDRHRRPRD